MWLARCIMHSAHRGRSCIAVISSPLVTDYILPQVFNLDKSLFIKLAWFSRLQSRWKEEMKTCIHDSAGTRGAGSSLPRAGLPRGLPIGLHGLSCVVIVCNRTRRSRVVAHQLVYYSTFRATEALFY